MAETNYTKFRGKCKDMSEALCEKDKSLTLVRGYYHCPLWGKQSHWWVKDKDGKIIDPTVEQFPTAGIAAEYEEYDGTGQCSECGKDVIVEESMTESNYVFCSSKCYGRFVGVF